MTEGAEQERKKKLEQDRGVYREALASTRKTAAGSKIMAPKEAIKLAIHLRSQMGQHAEAVMSIALVFAIAIDFADLVPIAGWFATLFIKPFLFVLLWGKGALKVRVARTVLIFLDLIPGLNALPWSTISVLYVYYNLKKQSKKSEIELAELKLQYKDAV